MRRLAALLTVTALLLLALPVLATGDYPTTPNDPCDEYHETRHPECQTTTTYATTTSAPTTTTPNETTTTTQETTTTVAETTTTFVEQTTTTVQECVPPLVHQPPLCVDPSTTVPIFDTTTTPTEPLEVLPFTGGSTGPLALSALALAILGGAMIRKGRTA